MCIRDSDHTEHDVNIVITEQGVADLRGKSPKERAQACLLYTSGIVTSPATISYNGTVMSGIPVQWLTG